ncbi:unnamed protein product [Saccharomyces cerevisiae]|nr:unnamed protein product [Saccharomyces cerevisiae]
MQTPSENTDTKLDTSNEPSAHLIEENVALPEDTFRSYLSYWIYDILHYKPFTIPIQNLDFEINLLVEVVKRKPAVKGREWRTIAYNMNQYLFDHRLWDTPYYFYDDEDCHSYFLSLIEGRTFKKQEESSASNVTDAQSNDETAGTPNEAIEFFTFHSGPNYQKYLSKAAEIEQQAQNNYWKERYPEMNAVL